MLFMSENTHEREVVYEFPKNSQEIVRASVGSYRGVRVFDIRVWASEDRLSHRAPKGVLSLAIARS
jgi:hypothetical protein